nr:acyl-CoA thioesterase [Aspergillus niger CBS 513.88]|eukprot:XP_001392555.2 acyl-CoA thioesterase [Aspergillus niger CBS 513.88]
MHDPTSNASPSSWAELMALRRLPNPPSSRTRAFGGHVYAQSAYAASQTVEKGFVIHSVSGTFILGGLLDVPYEYTVRHLRDGKMYCTRSVDVRQANQICFSCLCSFKRGEKQSGFAHQPAPVQERYASIISGKRAEDYPVSPSVDADWWIEGVKAGDLTEREFPGVDVRKVDMGTFNQGEDVKSHPERYRQLAMYSIKGLPVLGEEERRVREREEAGEFDNLALGETTWSSMASLMLTVVFHELGEALRMLDWGSEGNEGVGKKWFIQEGWTPRSAENRAVHESWLWTPDGKLLATSYQDSLLRLTSSRGKL